MRTIHLFLVIVVIFSVDDLWACELTRAVKFIPDSEIANEILTRLNPKVNQKNPPALIYGDPGAHQGDQGQAWSHYPTQVDSLTAYQSILRTIGPLLQSCEGEYQQLLEQVTRQQQFVQGLERVKVKTNVYTNIPALAPFTQRLREIVKAHENKDLFQLSAADEVTRLQFRLVLNSKSGALSIDYRDGQRNLGNFDISLPKVPDTYLKAGEVAAFMVSTIQEDLPLHLKLSLYSFPTPNWLVQIGGFNSDSLIKLGNRIYLLIFLLILTSFLYKWWHKRRAHFKEKTTE